MMGINSYIEAYKNFKDNMFPVHEREFVKLIKQGQQPKTLFISCSDSRIVPSLLFNEKPGDFFIIRNVGNIVPPYAKASSFPETTAAIEFAVMILKVQDIIICGHKDCGACINLYKDLSNMGVDNLQNWLSLNTKCKELSLLALDKQQNNQSLYEVTERISILCQIENLLTYPFVKTLIEEQKLFVHGWYYKIDSGEIEYYDSAAYEFKPLEQFIQD